MKVEVTHQAGQGTGCSRKRKQLMQRPRGTQPGWGVVTGGGRWKVGQHSWSGDNRMEEGARREALKAIS